MDQPQGDIVCPPRTHANKNPLVSNQTTYASKSFNSNPPHVAFDGQSGTEKWWSQDYQMLEGEVNKIIASDTSPINSENRKTKNEWSKQSPSPGGKKSPKKTNTTPKSSSSKLSMLDQNDVMRSSLSSTPPRKKLSPSKQTKAAALVTTLSSEIPLVQHLTMVNNHRIGYVPYTRIDKSSPEKTTYPVDEHSPTRSTRPHGLTPPTRYRPYEGLEGASSPPRSRSPYSPSPLSPSHSSALNTSINNMDDSTDISRQIDDKMTDVGKAISSLQVCLYPLFVIIYTSPSYLLDYYFVLLYSL